MKNINERYEQKYKRYFRMDDFSRPLRDGDFMVIDLPNAGSVGLLSDVPTGHDYRCIIEYSMNILDDCSAGIEV